MDKAETDSKWLVGYGAVLAGIVGYLWYTRQSYNSSEEAAQRRRSSHLEHGYQAQPVYRICITGGPCGGKTTCMKILRERFSSKGYRVFCVPEAATLTVHGGGNVVLNGLELGVKLESERLLMKIQLSLEQYFLKLASMSDMPSLILYDRGLVDGCAYITAEERDAIYDQQQWKMVQMRDDRYDLVMHLVTTADGAEEFYTKSNNNARSEGLELARELDQKTMAVWSAHPHFHVIPNVPGQTFQQKVNRCIHAIEDYIKPCSSSLRTKRFLVSQVKFPADLTKETFDMRVNFLRKRNRNIEEDKLVRRGNNDSNIYIRWTKKIQDGVEYYTQRRLEGHNYIKMLKEEADPKYAQLNFQRTVFVYQKQQFTLDDIKLEDRQILILSFYCRKKNLALAKLPFFVQVDRDISEEAEVALQTLSRIGCNRQDISEFLPEDDDD